MGEDQQGPIKVNFDKQHGLETATSGKGNGDKRLAYAAILRQRQEKVRKQQRISSVKIRQQLRST